MNKLILALGLMSITVAGGVSPDASAQTPAWPTKSVRLIVPLAPAGATDITARVVAQKLEQDWGQPVLIDNRPGGNTIVGTEFVAKAPPDGYTILVAASPFANNIALFPGKLPYDTQADFAPIAMIFNSPELLLINSDLPARNLAEFIALAKARRGKMFFATASVGGVTHLSGELLNIMEDLKATLVVYKGTAPAIADVAAGRVDFMFNGPIPVMAFIKSGKIRPLAATSAKRVSAFPDLPTMQEAGYPDFLALGWAGFIGQARMPRAVLTRINTSTNRALQQPDVMQRIEADGSVATQTTPEEFKAFIQSETVRWTKVIVEANVKPE